MANENNVVADFLGNTDDKDIFSEKVSTDEQVLDDVEQDEKPLPFHQDPKVQRYVEKQIAKALKDIPQTAERKFKDEVEEINLPSSFVELIGNDTPEKRKVLKDMSDYMTSIPEKAQQQFLEKQAEIAQKQTQAEQAAQEELESSLEQIEEDYKVDLSAGKALRTQFIEYVRKIAPKDENGDVSAFPDLVASFEEFQEKNKRPATRAKELASRGMTRSGDTTTAAPQGRSWKDVDKFLSTLSNKN
jgi:hypothetical protein